MSEKSIVVSGGGAGIGRALCRRLASDGFAVAVWDKQLSTASDTAQEIEAAGGKCVAVSCDVSSREQVDAALAATVEALGAPYGFASNAGIDRVGPFLDSNSEDWRAVIEVNYIGALNLAHAIVPAMAEAGEGSVVFVSSDAARVGSTNEAVYAGTKAALLGFAKTLARETARRGVRVNCVCPGPTDTALLAQLGEGPRGDKVLEGLKRAIPMGRIARPDDIASAIAFFFSEDAGYITGQTLSVSGGLTMV